uniref:uncharacterized protein n=1 Tax=Semicossyphus pulcher TaxID=241346 RepID=UPI0037E7FB8A
MSERRRALPSWMAKKEGKVTEKEPLKSTRKRKTARAVFYCMNEKELVEAAVSYLTNAASEDVALLTDHKDEDKAEDSTREIREKPATSKTLTEALQEDSFDCSDAQEMTYVSETDVDITEVETVPYTRSSQHQVPEGQRSGPETKKEHSQKPANAAEEEDDALCLVRQIFFT